MGLIAIDPNQGTVYRDGCWLWRTDLLLDSVAAASRQALWRLPTGTRVLGGLIDVTTFDSGTVLTGTVNLENNGGDVLLTAAAAIVLDTAVKRLAFTFNEADTGDAPGVLTAHDSAGTPVDVVLDIVTSTAPGSDAVITAGLFVARVDYDKAN